MDALNMRRPRAAVKRGEKRLQRAFLSLCYYLDIPITQVAARAREPKLSRAVRDEVAKADPLDPALNHRVQSLVLTFFYRPASSSRECEANRARTNTDSTD